MITPCHHVLNMVGILNGDENCERKFPVNLENKIVEIHRISNFFFFLNDRSLIVGFDAVSIQHYFVTYYFLILQVHMFGFLRGVFYIISFQFGHASLDDLYIFHINLPMFQLFPSFSSLYEGMFFVDNFGILFEQRTFECGSYDHLKMASSLNNSGKYTPL